MPKAVICGVDGKHIALASSAKEDEFETYKEAARIEDLAHAETSPDDEAAAKAGLRTIDLLCDGWSEDGLKHAGCIAIYKDPADLLACYGQFSLASDGGR